MARAVPPMPDSLTDALTKKDAKDAGGGNMAGVAVVDMTRLYNASGAAAEYERKAGEVSSDAQQRMKAISGVSQLAPADLQEFVTLAGKTAPTEAEQRRQKELLALSEQRTADYRALQSKTDPTPTDNRNLRAFADQDKLFRDQLLPSIAEGVPAGRRGPHGCVSRRADESDSRRHRAGRETKTNHARI